MIRSAKHTHNHGLKCLFSLAFLLLSAHWMQAQETTATKFELQSDSVFAAPVIQDSLIVYKPDPSKAVWYSALFPGLGQLYNRRYWKIPVVAAGAAAITYAISWNNKYYIAYTNAYRDYTDDNPNTNSYLDLLPPGSNYYSSSNFGTLLRNRQQSYRRSRDLSVIGAAGIYLICILDAYVDAQLYDFDISPDLSVQPSIQLNPMPMGPGDSRIDIGLAFHF